MLDFIAGIPDSISSQGVVIHAAGVGYFIRITEPVARELQEIDVTPGKAIGGIFKIYVHQQLLSEQGEIRLYGFLDRADRDFFRRLLSISGVGPNTAMGVMGAGNAEQIREMIRNKDVAGFKKCKGIGAKTAEKIIHELQHG